MQIFLDCDGVLADFDGYSSELFGQPICITNQTQMIDSFWETIYGHEDFYNRLPLLPDARQLFDSVKFLDPIILTGLPKLHKDTGWARIQKEQWAARHFPGTKIITCMSEDKKLYMKPGDILVDDWTRYKPDWEAAGGIFIVHTSAQDTIEQLKKIGVL